MKVILYSTGCPKCKVLKKKLDDHGICFEEFTDTEQMVRMDIESVPTLSVDGTLMDFSSAVAWLNYSNHPAQDSGECESCKLS